MKTNVWIFNHYASSDYLDRGGRHYNISKYLKEFGYDPIVFCAQTMHNTDEVKDLQGHLFRAVDAPTGVPYIFVKCRPYVGNGKQRVLNMIDFYCNVKKAARQYAAQHGKPDVIFASSVHPLTLVAGIQLAKHFGVKCICEVRDLWPESIVAYGIAGPKNPIVIALRWLEKWIYKKADAIVFTMEGAYDYIVEQGWEKDIPRSKMHYINNGVDLEQFDYNKEHYTVEDPDLDDPNTFKVVYTGSIRRVNNLGLLLDAAKQVTDPRVKFLIWGDGDEREALTQRVKDELITNVVFKGRVEKKYIPSIVSRADVNYMHGETNPLNRFGLSPNKLFDYFAAGRPVLSDLPCRYDPVMQFGAGITVDPPTADHIADALTGLAGLSAEAYTALCRAAESAAAAFDFKALTDKLMQIIKEG